MTGHRTEAPDGFDDLARDPARASRQVPGPRRQAAQGSRRSDARRAPGRGGRSAQRQSRPVARPGRVAAVALALPIIGAAADEMLNSGLGWLFAIGAALGAALAARACTRAGAWWVISAPPLVVAAITVGAGALTDGLPHGKGMTTTMVRWAVDAFPAMAAAEVVMIAVLAIRLIQVRRSGRNGRA